MLRGLQLAVYLLFFGAVVFFALTRTEVGRDELRQQVQAQFAERFAGSLQIGTLRGNLLNVLYASDVEIRGPDGGVVAAVDSVVARPQWQSLFGGTLSIRSVTLVRPALFLRRQADASWNAAAAFERTGSSTGGARVDVTVADVQIRSGRIQTANPHEVPQPVRRGWLFDYTNASVRNLQAQATLEWAPGQRLVEVYDVSMDVPDANLQVAGLQAQVTRSRRGWNLTQIDLATPGSRLTGSGRFQRRNGAAPRLDIDLQPSQIDPADLRGVVPRIALQGRLDLEADIQGPLSDLVVETLSVAHRSSTLQLSGTVLGLPDSVDAEVRVRDTRLRAADVRSLWPDAPLNDLPAVSDLSFDGFVAGTVAWKNRDRPTFDVESKLDVVSPEGAVAGSLRVQRSAEAPPAYRAALRTDSLDVGALTRQPSLASRLNGQIRLSGQGRPRSSALAGTAQVQLDASQFAGQPLDTLDASITADGGSVEAVVDVRQPGGGRFRGRGRFDGSRAIPSYQFALASLGFDLSQWPVGLPQTRLNGVATVQGRGTTWGDLAGTLSVRVDTSTIVRSDSTTVLPPHWTTLHVAERRSDEPRIRLYGSVGSLQVDGDVPLPALADLSRLWGTALRDAFRDEMRSLSPRPDGPSLVGAVVQRKGSAPAAEEPAPAVASRPLPSSRPSPPSRLGRVGQRAAVGRLVGGRKEAGRDSAAQTTASPRAALQERVRVALRAAGYDRPIHLRTSLHMDQPSVFRAWMPGLPAVDAPVRLASQLTAGADTLALAAQARAGRLAVGASAASGLRLSVRTSASLRAPLPETFRSRVEWSADSLHRGDRRLRALAGVAAYADRSGRVHVTAGTPSPPADASPPPSPRSDLPQMEEAPVSGKAPRLPSSTAPYRLRVGVDLRPDRALLTVQDLVVRTGSGTWATDAPGRIHLFRDAAVFETLTLQSPQPRTAIPQSLRVRGTLSNAPSDSVFVEASDVLLRPLFDTAGLRRPVGGLVNGTVVVTGGPAAPDVAATAQVHRLSFDRRLLGRLQLSARHRAGSPSLEVAARLRPDPGPLDSLMTSPLPLVPGGMRTAEENRLDLTGSIRLPSLLPLTRPAGAASANGRTARNPSSSSSSPVLDLRLDVERADLFFFEYIFQDQIDTVRGYTAGSGTITGRWTDPVFDADMVVRDGAFSLPQFGLRYDLEGRVGVDRDGFHLRNVSVRDGDGRARIDGDILFNAYRYFSFDLRGTLDELQIIDVDDAQDLPFYGDIRASASATLTGPLSDARLSTAAARTTPDSELFIPVSEDDAESDSGFIIFADSTGQLPDIRDLTRRDNLLSDRPAGEASFLDGLEMDINVIAPEGSTVHLVFDPLIGDVVTAVGSGRVQLQQEEGEFLTYGQFNVSGGDYLFTAGEVFVRRFAIEEGTLTWDGDPINARLDLDAAYRTRASTRGLPRETDSAGRIPVVINLDITGRVETPQVDLSLALARDERGQLVGTQTLDAILNQPETATEYATSVLLTNTFLLTTSSGASASPESGEDNRLATAGNQLAFNSVSQLVASQLNRYLSAALPNVDINFGLQGENPEDLDVIYGVALRLLDERLIIRGEGVYTGDEPDDPQTSSGLGPQGEFVVEVRLTRRVSAEVFFRRQGDDVARDLLTQTAGVGLSYQSEFSTWRQLYERLFGWLGGSDDDASPPDTSDDALARRPDAAAAPPPLRPPAAPESTAAPDSTRPGSRPADAPRPDGGRRNRPR